VDVWISDLVFSLPQFVCMLPTEVQLYWCLCVCVHFDRCGVFDG